MEYFNLGLPAVLEIINNVLDGARSGMIWSGIAGVGLAVLLIVLGFRFRLFSRKNKVLRTVKFVYPLYLLLICTGFGLAIGGLHSGKQALIDSVPKKVRPMTILSFSGYQFFVRRNWDYIERESVPLQATLDRFTEGVKFEPYLDDWAETKKVEMANAISPQATQWGILSVLDSAMKESSVSQQALEPDQYDKAALNVAHDLDITTKPDEFWVKVDTAIQARISDECYGFYLMLIGGFLVLLLLPVIETIFSVVRRRA